MTPSTRSGSDGYPDLPELRQVLHRYKHSVDVFEQAHPYHFVTHGGLHRSRVQEYLVIGY